jgi:hypothetical protein
VQDTNDAIKDAGDFARQRSLIRDSDKCPVPAIIWKVKNDAPVQNVTTDTQAEITDVLRRLRGEEFQNDLGQLYARLPY